jgi:TM2 domain-containing membrane protein YozV
MTSRPKFCSNCGETLDLDKEIKKCSKCGIDLQQQEVGSTHNKSIVGQLPYKSPGTAALIAFIGGIFALPGIGHIYVGKVGKGIGILISGIIIYVLLIIMAFSLQSTLFLAPDESSAVGGGAILMMFILGIVYFVLWIWQIFDARKLAKKFNESVRTTGGKEPW